MKLIRITKNSKRLGRGTGCGVGGHTVGRGTKGQKSRSGYIQPRPGFEGGRMPLARRLPKLRGFSRAIIDNAEKYVVSLTAIDKAFKDGETVNELTIIEKGLIKGTSKNYEIKVLNNGEIKKKLTFEGIEMSESAKNAITKAGGKIS
jgi:large subunit ribosomal protein L15